jgi:hypothetical protein
MTYTLTLTLTCRGEERSHAASRAPWTTIWHGDDRHGWQQHAEVLGKDGVVVPPLVLLVMDGDSEVTEWQVSFFLFGSMN